RAARGHVARRPAPARARRARRAERGLAVAPLRPAPRPHRPVAGLRPLAHPVPGHDQVRLPVRRRLVTGTRHRDPPRYAPGRDLRSGRVLIDLHFHALPGVDDGPATLEDALALLRGAYDAGTRTVVATPHVIKRYPTTPEQIFEGVAALRAAGAPVEVLAGAEVAH